jgi:hypothetical protein
MYVLRRLMRDTRSLSDLRPRSAVQVYRRLAGQRPKAFLPDLAMSPYNLSDRLADLRPVSLGS